MSSQTYGRRRGRRCRPTAGSARSIPAPPALMSSCRSILGTRLPRSCPSVRSRGSRPTCCSSRAWIAPQPSGWRSALLTARRSRSQARSQTGSLGWDHEMRLIRPFLIVFTATVLLGIPAAFWFLNWRDAEITAYVWNEDAKPHVLRVVDDWTGHLIQTGEIAPGSVAVVYHGRPDEWWVIPDTAGDR